MLPILAREKQKKKSSETSHQPVEMVAECYLYSSNESDVALQEPACSALL